MVPTRMPTFTYTMKKIVVANRGEIALRIIRSVHEMGLQAVAVFSTADRDMPFVQAADEAVCIGDPPSAQSYLRGEKIIEVARSLGADAIHPGYGFLSENAAFARQVEAAGLVFIGPSAHSIAMMGDKLTAKQAARKFGVPLVPGTDEPLTDSRQALAVARAIGFPVLIKASAGGGGKGMRIVRQAEELEEQLATARREAKSAFGDDAVFIEKYVGSPRHIEIQVLGDQHGHYLCLFERECSIQRRHQKVIEEAPSTCLSPAMRKEMGACAVNVARACGYYGAGTVEFLVDDSDEQHPAFYFLEMNTRLQVEHPVTEWITGLDLVKEQIRIARNEPLSLKQEALRMQGHAIELRVCAEDPTHDFLPDTGTLLQYERPSGPGVRVDDGYRVGLEVPVYYDPLLAKLIVWGEDREEAIRRMVRAISEYQVVGVETTLGFGSWAVQHPAFVSGKFNTHFIAQYFSPEVLQHADPEISAVAGLLAVHLWEQQQAGLVAANDGNPPLKQTRWKRRTRRDRF